MAKSKGVHRDTGPSLTQQGQAEEADINTLVARYLRTGVPDARLAGRRPIFGDFSDFDDFQSMMNKVAQVKTEFMSLPSRYRARFSNSPSELVRFVNDPVNRPEAIRMGLLLPTEKEVDSAIDAQRKAGIKARAAAQAAQAAGEQIDLVDEAEKPKKKPKPE